MEFRDKLLSSDIRHITDLVNVLSYELVIMQDFMMQQFGTNFKKFRERHLLSCEVKRNETASTKSARKPRSTNTINARTSTSQEERNNADFEDIDDEGENEHSFTGVSSENVDPLASQVIGNNAEIATNDQHLSVDETFEEGEIHFDNTSFMEGRDDSDFDVDLESDNSSEGRTWFNKMETGGRKTIWKQYHCKRLPNGKKIARCRKCHERVSPVAKRLEKHYQQCVKCVKVTSSPAPSTPVAKLESGSEEQVKKGRKPLGAVWKYFNKTITSDGQTIITCKFCEKKVSNHATRMTRHLQQTCEKKPELSDLETL